MSYGKDSITWTKPNSTILRTSTFRSTPITFPHPEKGPEFFAEYQIREIAEEMARHHALPARMLDFGAGVGTWIPG